MTTVHRVLALTIVLLLGAEAPLHARQAEPDVALGIRLVMEGDFESAIPALQAATQRLTADPARAVERARGLLYLGVAQVGLDLADDARASFVAALRADPRLSPTTADFSPKVVQAFEAARAQVRSEDAPRRAAGRRRSRTPWIAGGIGAAAVGGVIAARAGGGEDDVRFTNARFGTPVIVCPNGSHDLPLPFTILVDAEADAPAAIGSVTTTVIIVASAFAPEIGFASSVATTVTPPSVPSGRTTLALQSTILCGNGSNDDPRFNEWSGRLTITTAGGTTTLATADRMRVNIP